MTGTHDPHDGSARTDRSRDHARRLRRLGDRWRGLQVRLGQPVEDEDSIAAIRRALERGVNWIDTAAIYGIGRSERVVGAALAGLAERPFVFTKGSRVGRRRRPDRRLSLKRDSLRRELEASLERLRPRRGRPVPDAPAESRRRTSKRAGRARRAASAEGLARHIGVSNFASSSSAGSAAIASVETLQPPYSLVAREAEETVLPFCEARGHRRDRLLPDGSGMLTGAMTRERIAAPAGRRLAWHAHPRFQRRPSSREPRPRRDRLGGDRALAHGASAGRRCGGLDARESGRRRGDRRVPRRGTRSRDRWPARHSSSSIARRTSS